MVSNPATGIESKFSVLVDYGNVTPEALKNALKNALLVVAYFGLAVLPGREFDLAVANSRDGCHQLFARSPGMTADV